MSRSFATAAWALPALALLTGGCDSMVTKPSLYGSVDVRVTARSGAPIANVPLTLYTGERPMGYARTDTNGTYMFVDVPQGRYGVLADVPPGYARLSDVVPAPRTDYVEELKVEGGSVPTARLSFLKKGPGTIVASVTEPDGSPVSAIPVTLYGSTGPIRSAITGTNGRFVFDPAPFGNLGVSAQRSAAYLDSAESPFIARDRIVVDEGSTHLAQFTFVPCIGSITATVRDEAASPVPGATVTLYASTRVITEGTVDAAGSRQFANLGCADYGVSVRTPIGWTVLPGRGASFADGLYVHRGGTLTPVLSVRRVTCRATLRVRVSDDQGTAVAGARLVLYASVEAYREVITGADGLGTMDQIPCDREFGVYVAAPVGYAVAAGRGSSYFDAILFADRSVVDRTFVLTRVTCRATLRVRVRDDQGTAVAGARLVLYSSVQAYREVITGADGLGTMDQIPCDREFGVYVTPPVGYAVAAGRGSSYFDAILFADGSIVDRTFVLTRR